MSDRWTPGPWRWEINLKSRQLQLCGGRPLYELTVMDFKRWGMRGAQPRFLTDVGTGGMMLSEAEHFATVVPGREHHSEWFQTLNNPNARLISAAPDMAEALDRLLEMFNLRPDIHKFLGFKEHEDIAAACMALAKARGQA